jgi:hypothetical protein
VPLPSDVQRLSDLGYSVVPGDLDKRPKVQWGQWRDRPQTGEETLDLGHGSVWGILTGQAHGLVVLDFDGDEGVALAKELGLTPNVITGSGGWHVWLDAHAIPYPVKTCAAVRPGLDVRGEGGLVWVAGRSRKGEYSLITDYRSAGASVIARLLPLLPERTAPTGGADFGDWDGEGDGTVHALRVLRASADRVAAAPPGTRNAALNKAAYSIGGLVASGELDPDTAGIVLVQAAERSNTDGLWPGEEMIKVVQSAFASGALSPWSAEPEVDEDGEVWLSTSDISFSAPSGAGTWDPQRRDLPLDAFPKEVRALVEAGAPLTACPPQYIAAATLPALAAAIGGTTTLDLRSTWRIPPSMYVGLVGPPSASKTPALGLALAPVRAAENSEWETADGDPETRYLIDDVTAEKLGELLGAHDRGLLMAVDELKGFFGGMGQYKDGAGRDRQFYLSAWSSQPITVDRIKRGSLHVARPTLSIVGGIQPSVFDQLTDGEPDGMMERFLLVFGEAQPDAWCEDDIPALVLANYSDLWNGIRDSNMQERSVSLTPAARNSWKRWYDSFHAVPAEDRLAGMHGKMRTHVARLALILACCDDTSVAPEHVDRAIAIADWFSGETMHVLRTAESSSRDERRHLKVRDRVAVFLVTWEQKHGRRPTKTEALQYGPYGARRAKDLDPILAELGVVL